jgi:hypothetical protein
MGRVNRNETNVEVLGLVLFGRYVATTLRDTHRHLELAVRRKRGDVNIGVDDLDLGRALELARRHLTRPLGLEIEEGRTLAVDLERYLLEIEDDIGDILDHARHCRELVVRALDLDRGDRGGGNRRQQGPTQPVAKSGSPATFEWLGEETSEAGAVALVFQLNVCGSLKILPDHAASTLARVKLDDELLLDRETDVFADRALDNLARECARVELQPRRDAAALSELDCLRYVGILATLFAYCDLHARTDPEGGDVDSATVDLDVAVPDELAGLGARGRKTERVDNVAGSHR